MGHKRYQLQSNEANCFNFGFRLRSLHIPPVSTVPRGGQSEKLERKRQGLGLGTEPSVPKLVWMPFLSCRFCFCFLFIHSSFRVAV